MNGLITYYIYTSNIYIYNIYSHWVGWSTKVCLSSWIFVQHQDVLEGSGDLDLSTPLMEMGSLPHRWGISPGKSKRVEIGPSSSIFSWTMVENGENIEYRNFSPKFISNLLFLQSEIPCQICPPPICSFHPGEKNRDLGDLGGDFLTGAKRREFSGMIHNSYQ